MLSEDKVDRLREVYAAHPAVRAAYVFGSVAIDREQANSDLDLGIVVDPDRWEPTDDKIPLIGDCMDAAKRDRVDLVGAGRIRRELKQIEAVVDRAQDVWDGVDPDRPVDHRIDAVALNLHGFYAGLERVFRTVAERMNTELNSVRPPVLSNEARKKLDQYRGFRHVVRNVYAFEFDPEQLDLLVKRLPDIAEVVFSDLRAFADTLDRMASSEE